MKKKWRIDDAILALQLCHSDVTLSIDEIETILVSWRAKGKYKLNTVKQIRYVGNYEINWHLKNKTKQKRHVYLLKNTIFCVFLLKAYKSWCRGS